jgi:hypothetical protein
MEIGNALDIHGVPECTGYCPYYQIFTVSGCPEFGVCTHEDRGKDENLHVCYPKIVELMRKFSDTELFSETS